MTTEVHDTLFLRIGRSFLFTIIFLLQNVWWASTTRSIFF